MSSPPSDNIPVRSPSSAGRISPVLIRRHSVDHADGPENSPTRPRLSPTLIRSYDLNDADVRERQRIMDVDMAMQFSLARRETITAHTSSPTVPISYDSPAHASGTVSAPSAPQVAIPSPYEHRQSRVSFPELSSTEQHQLDLARDGAATDTESADGGDDATLLQMANDTPPEDNEPSMSRSVQTQKPPQPQPHQQQQQQQQSSRTLPLRHATSSTIILPPADPEGLPTYQQNVTNFDFGPMEEFATAEKIALGITSPPHTFGAGSSSVAFRIAADRNVSNGFPETVFSPSSAEEPGPSDPAAAAVHRARQRKLSQSNAPRRKGIGGKMALFESNNAADFPASFPARLFGSSTGVDAPYGDSRGGDNHTTLVGGASIGGDGGGGGGGIGGSNNYFTSPGAPGGILNTGHDRPYRFSFYSNALSATIHARSLSELPAEGQTFEQLFAGINPDPAAATAAAMMGTVGLKPGEEDGPRSVAHSARTMDTHFSASAAGGGASTPRRNGGGSSNGEKFGNGGMHHFASRNRLGGGVGAGGGDFESNTWWLDVQSPTDEEMRVLSKVFNIHPLTTEDIQMEETREKIELFRNYYLVCFRGFDQDPYSPTYLEPLNMYILVFREGTLSFHFRPTPHPQNVRRRIKQFKDYISVTSDWISYALIDDITDAFGPLIQSIEYEVDTIDELVLILKEAEQSDMLRRIGTCRKKVMGLLRLMGNKADVVKGLAKRCNENWSVAPTSDIGLYLSDIQDHLITMTQNLNHYEKILSRSHSNYLAQISIEMTDANNQINDVLSKLTALGTVLIPMNLVTGLWGMNVHVPGQDVDGYAWFVSIIACLAAFAVVGGYLTYKLLVRK